MSQTTQPDKQQKTVLTDPNKTEFLGHINEEHQDELAMFAQALLRRPKILLLDEPVSALDMAHQINLLQKVSHYSQEHQLICLMVLHDLSLAAQFSDQLLLLADGKIQAQGTPQEVLQPQILRQVYQVDIEILTSSRGLPVMHPYRKAQ